MSITSSELVLVYKNERQAYAVKCTCHGLLRRGGLQLLSYTIRLTYFALFFGNCSSLTNETVLKICPSGELAFKPHKSSFSSVDIIQKHNFRHSSKTTVFGRCLSLEEKLCISLMFTRKALYIKQLFTALSLVNDLC